MEMKKASKSIWKHVICCSIILIVFVVTIGTHGNADSSLEEPIAESTSEVVPLKANFDDNVVLLSQLEGKRLEMAGPRDHVTVLYNEAEAFISTYEEELEFFSKCFGVKLDNVKKDIIEIYHKHGELIETNVGHLESKSGDLKKFNSVERGIVEYFYDFVKRNPALVSNKRVAYKGNAEYVENLIIYYTTKVYTNVDTNTALAIGAAESGYYKVKYMLGCNNVYGGMSSKGLTKHKNIEYGVLSYIRMLSKGYYGKGLNTVSKIGYKYCPKKDNNGNKVASPHWINLVNKAKKYYGSKDLDIKVDDLTVKKVNI